MANALFMNGVFDSVLAEILKAQVDQDAGELFLQPFSGQAVVMLRKSPPAHKLPVRLYISTSMNLGQVCYTAEIVKWEDKRSLSANRRKQILRQLRKYQSEGEVLLFDGDGEKAKKAINLITIRNLVRLETLQSTSILRKVSDGTPLKKRTQPGGWSPVLDIGDLLNLSIETEDQYEADLRKAVKASGKLSDSVLKKRLAKAPKMPSRVQVITTGYRRNPHVIVAVLRRANDICECCNEPAPFLRKSDGSPYLEVHHWKPLSQDGEDTIENAGAICPNCHRELHHGQS